MEKHLSNGVSTNSKSLSKDTGVKLEPENLAIETAAIVASDLPASEVIDTLTKRVLDTRTYLPKYSYFLDPNFHL